MTTSQPDPDRREALAAAARSQARQAAITIARDVGADIITRPAFRGSSYAVRDVDPLAGIRAARQIELGALRAARDYIRAAREAGHSWHDIGTALDLHTRNAPDYGVETTAEAAYNYAAGGPDTEYARRYGRSFAWTCPSCDSVISDRGLSNGPADDEHGHADGCPQLAGTVAAWDAESKAGQ